MQTADSAAIRTDILILGGRISGLSSAAYLKKKFPHLDVTVVARQDLSPPLVGESTVGVTSLFFNACGLTRLLNEQCTRKYGLTYYFKANIDDPADRRYAIHEKLALDPAPEWQINRFQFDKDVRIHDEQLGVRFIDGVVTDVVVRRRAHQAKVQLHAGGERTITGRWLIDATGRSGLIARAMGVRIRPEIQRSVFWMRVANVDEGLIRGLVQEMREQHPDQPAQDSYDSYYATHHFLGRGYWVWLIPLRSEDPSEKNLMSIGVTQRPDLFGRRLSTLQQVLDQLDSEHPVVAQLIRSGAVRDTNKYFDYFYSATQLYSEDGWFLVGDAANSVDPLYSNGMMITAFHVTQVGELIAQDLRGKLDAALVRTFDENARTLYGSISDAINRHFEAMHDPYQSHLHIHFSTAVYFYLILPWFVRRYHLEPSGAALMTQLLSQAKSASARFADLAELASRSLGEVGPEKIHNWYDQTVNYNSGIVKETEFAAHLERLMMIHASMKESVVRDIHFGDRAQDRLLLLAECKKDAVKARAVGALFGGSALRANGVFRALVGMQEGKWNLGIFGAANLWSQVATLLKNQEEMARSLDELKAALAERDGAGRGARASDVVELAVEVEAPTVPEA